MENVDRGRVFSYNRTMVGKMRKIRLVLRILLSVATALWLSFILSNSLKTAEQSATQSSTIVETVQQVAQIVAPESKIANATGEAYDALHAFVRNCAHLVEFAVLGALCCWCYFAYTLQRKYFYIPLLGVLFVPFLDEYLQTFSLGRGVELTDLALDICGGLAGMLFAACCVMIGVRIYCKRKRSHHVCE